MTEIIVILATPFIVFLLAYYSAFLADRIVLACKKDFYELKDKKSD